MDRADITFWLSIVGAGTSIVLALIKAYEFLSTNRIRLVIAANLTGSQEIGNTISILNRSSIPANLHYFDLAWTARRSLFRYSIPFTRKIIREDSPIEAWDTYNAVIAPHATHQLHFADENYFEWGDDLKQDIYLRLWLIGRSGPIWLWITGP